MERSEEEEKGRDEQASPPQELIAIGKNMSGDSDADADADCFLDRLPKTYAISSTVAENEQKQRKISLQLDSRLPPIDKISQLRSHP